MLFSLWVVFVWAMNAVSVMGSNVETSWIETLDPHGNMKYSELIDNLKFIMEDQHLYVRADDDDDLLSTESNPTLNNILVNVYESGLIVDVLYEISQSDAQINNLVGAIGGLASGENSSFQFDQLNISINTDDLLDTIMDSGLITTVFSGLLMNDTRRETLGDLVGYFLVHNIWVGKLLNELGAGKDLTVKLIADTIRYTPNLNPKYNSSISQDKQATFSFNSRDDIDDLFNSVLKANEGSAADFLSNLINGVLSSSLFSTSLGAIVNGLNDTGIVAPLVMDVLQNDTIVSMFPKLVSGLYDEGIFDGIDTNKYFQYAKKEGILSNFLEDVLTSPTWEPPLALVLKQLEDNGVFKDIEDGLFGPN